MNGVISKEKLVLFVKAPVPGRVKTRLAPPLSYEEACGLYRSWSLEIFESVKHLREISIEVAYDPHEDFPTPAWLGAEGEDIRFFLQSGSTLGDKLIHAFDHAFSSGAEKAVIIGSDSPGLPLDFIRQGLAALGEHELALGPARDGGYYLVGLKGKTVPDLFQGISWSGPEVLSQTLKKAEDLGLKFSLLPEYFDIDGPEDLGFARLERPARPARGVIP